MGMLKQSQIEKCEELHLVLDSFPGVEYNRLLTRAIVAKCPDPLTAREVTQAVNNRAIAGVKVIPSTLFPMDVYIAVTLH